MPALRVIRLKAPAKINLGLVIGERKPDGYHDLTTIFSRISLFDEIQMKISDSGFEPQISRIAQKAINGNLRNRRPGSRDRIARSRIVLRVDAPAGVQLPTGKDNLCVKAARLFLTETGIKARVEIDLNKRIPVGAGLGGGSSDAAAVLRGLNLLCGRPLNRQELRDLARALGADVPFFLTSKPCLATGRGDALKPLELPRMHILLHVPEFQVNTTWAYRELDRLRSRQANPGRELTGQTICLNIALARLKAGRFKAIGDLLVNSFEQLVFRLHPELNRVRTRLLASGAEAALLSGSGSALFALVDPAHRKRVEQALKLKCVPFMRLETIS